MFTMSNSTRQVLTRPLESGDIKKFLNEIKRAERIIAESMAAIDQATKIISASQAQIYLLLDNYGNNVQSSLLPNHGIPLPPDDPNEDDNSGSRNAPISGFYCPDCAKENTGKKALLRHYATHVLCTQISDKDSACICCGQAMKTASNFFKYHAKCLARMADQLPREKEVQASQQKKRIKTAVEECLRKRKPHNRGEDNGHLPKRPRVDADALRFLATPKFYQTLPNTTFQDATNPSGTTNPSGITNLPGIANVPSTRDSPNQAGFSNQTDFPSMTDFPNTLTNIDDSFFRGLVIAQNPVDGDWNIM